MTAEQPIVLSTFGSLVRHGYRMGVHCWRCERGVTIDAAAFPPELSYGRPAVSVFLRRAVLADDFQTVIQHDALRL